MSEHSQPDCTFCWKDDVSCPFVQLAARDAEVAALTARLDELLRGITRAHMHLAERLHESNTYWLMVYLEGLLRGQPANEAAEYARAVIKKESGS